MKEVIEIQIEETAILGTLKMFLAEAGYIPKYDEIPVTVIMNNMKTVGMTREEYLSIMESI